MSAAHAITVLAHAMEALIVFTKFVAVHWMAALVVFTSLLLCTGVLAGCMCCCS